MINNVFPIARKEDVVVQELPDEVLIYDLKSKKAMCLNEISAFVWQNCDGKKTISQISQLAKDQLKKDSSEELVWLALNQLKKENLLENVESIEGDFNGLSRRDVIKKVGLTTMIALPLISSIVAPMAVFAASGCQETQTITTTNRTCAAVPGCAALCNVVYPGVGTVLSCTDDFGAPGTRGCICCFPV